MTEFYLVRHAQPNYQNRSETDRELTPKGASDCRYVTQYLEDHGVTTMYSSPYRRAVDTVRGYAEKHSLPITFDSDLRERGIDDSWVTDFKDFMRRQWADFSYKLPGGESLSEVQTRVVTAIRRIAKAHPGESIAAGGHGTGKACPGFGLQPKCPAGVCSASPPACRRIVIPAAVVYNTGISDNKKETGKQHGRKKRSAAFYRRRLLRQSGTGRLGSDPAI